MHGHSCHRLCLCWRMKPHCFRHQRSLASTVNTARGAVQGN
uniref:Uncharacterized protein n=1 Tax=Arundo donax TaxID=35708 RepID=A0A0A9AXC7_ARUDO